MTWYQFWNYAFWGLACFCLLSCISAMPGEEHAQRSAIDERHIEQNRATLPTPSQPTELELHRCLLLHVVEILRIFVMRIKHLYLAHGLPRWLSGKESACQCNRHWFDLWLGKIFWRKWQPTLVFILGKSHRQRSLVGYSLWDHTELDTTEQLGTSPIWLIHPVLSFCSCLTLVMSVSSTFSTRDWTRRFLRIFSSLKLFNVFSRPLIIPLVDYPPGSLGWAFIVSS